MTIWSESDILKRAIGDAPHTIEVMYERLVPLMANSKVVLFGEATHGSHEFYEIRAELTKRLIEQQGFSVVAVEADWPEAYGVNRYVKGRDGEGSARDALQLFNRFPTWMWGNTAVEEFSEWLHDFNRHLSPDKQVSFYGLDLYSLYSSIDAVLDYLDKVDPTGATRARSRYACFTHHGTDPQGFGFATSLGLTSGCDERAVEQLQELQAKRFEYLRRDGILAEDAQFSAEQNATIVVQSAAYYHAMFKHPHSTWNLRDTHMFNTLEALRLHHSRIGDAAKVVVWEHNSHIGDARATEFSRRGQLNIGQLVRQRFGDACCLIGFTTYEGEVMAAPEWGSEGRVKAVNPALEESFERLFHRTGASQFFLLLREHSAVRELLCEPRLERAIGVVYHPHTERYSHYFTASLAEQFDAVIHVDETSAVTPLAIRPEKLLEEPPETFPSGV